MCFNQNKKGDFSILKGGSLKLVDEFIYLGSNVSSTEKNINTRLAKTWTAIDRLSVIWRSDMSDKIEQFFFKQQSCPYYYMDVSARGVMVIVVGNGHGDTSSNPDWLHSHSTDTLGKGMNPIILPPAMGK